MSEDGRAVAVRKPEVRNSDDVAVAHDARDALAERDVVQLTEGSAPGDPEVDFPPGTSGDDAAFELLRDVINELGSHPLRGLKDQLRKRQEDFSEKRHGYGAFRQFVKAAQAQGFVDLDDDDVVKPKAPDPASDRVLSKTTVRRKSKPKA